jgi:hypothetical protein
VLAAGRDDERSARGEHSASIAFAMRATAESAAGRAPSSPATSVVRTPLCADSERSGRTRRRAAECLERRLAAGVCRNEQCIVEHDEHVKLTRPPVDVRLLLVVRVFAQEVGRV